MARRAARIDGNQPVIVAELQRRGCCVQSLARLGGGVPDLLVGVGGHNILLEVKMHKGKLTPAQEKWHEAWFGQVAVVETAEEAFDVINRVMFAHGERIT